MTQPPEPEPSSLTALQRTRIDYARRDLENARAEELTQLPPSGLILMIERLRHRLGDMLDLMTEVHRDTSVRPNDPNHHQ
ncbi:hypothetical protein [Streptomyces sp. C1-2]|uniref:hypothetical protein n=1 Tax=Streptomyces sp. C1-2 TaxID=2720022 RepID=UPI0014326061|nr:hypothetical protein [Streptomyces sp. C1-2]NJP70059.1 hypothetical protein [Streptomyces sp. C1-2]